MDKGQAIVILIKPNPSLPNQSPIANPTPAFLKVTFLIHPRII